MIVLIFVLSQLSCFELSFPSCHSSFLVLLSLHRSITSTPSILLSILLFSVQCVDTSFCSWIRSSHLLWRLVKTTSNVFWCQKLSALIIYMIWEIITGSYLCRFDSRGVTPIPSIIDTIYIKTQVFRLLGYYSPALRYMARSVWATQNITHNMTSSIIQPYGLHSF